VRNPNRQSGSLQAEAEAVPPSTACSYPRTRGRLRSSEESQPKAPSYPRTRGRLPGRSPPLIMYYGDDAGDEPAFAALGTRGVSVIVGRRKQTRARYFLHSPAEVQGFLRLLARTSGETTPPSSPVPPA
jgi:hypothetical protein